MGKGVIIYNQKEGRTKHSKSKGAVNMTKIERKCLQGLAEKAWERLKAAERFYGEDSIEAKCTRGEWYAYNRICYQFDIDYKCH